MKDEKYLELLAEKYPTEQAVCREIINLKAILGLPKGTEHFMSDLHGEYEAFCHILNNCSGVIREKVDLLFEETLSDIDREEICTLIYYPVEKLEMMKKESRLVREMDLAQNGTLVFAYVTLDLIRELEATEEDLEDISAFIGQLEGVDNAVTIRQLKPEECKISLRTDGKTLNASAVCAVYGGGGHAAAAGCTIQGTPAQAKAAMLKAIEQVQHG